MAAELLKTLEYRGYDSTGAAFQAAGEEITLRKGVGAPSVMVEELGITGLAGSIMCGQVRWATFGSVDDLNAQPHEVRCHTHLYGAHNGNVTNCDDLKGWLAALGHEVISDNDGEMVVHTVEHFFAERLAARGNPDRDDPVERREAMREAIVAAADRLHGSYAAVVVDPVSRTLWAIKEGSSLYFGFGRDDEGGDFALASSDLSSVLKLTRVLVPMAEGEFIEYTSGAWQIHAIKERGSTKAGAPLDRQPVRSRLQASDAALLPDFQWYMEQEIAAQDDTFRRVATLFKGGSEACRALSSVLESTTSEDRAAIDAAVAEMSYEYEDEAILRRFRDLLGLRSWGRLVEHTPDQIRAMALGSPGSTRELTSQESGLLSDLLRMAESDEERLSVHLLDLMAEQEEVTTFLTSVDSFIHACTSSINSGGRILVACCGSSYHAAMAGAVFFNEIA
ncbi:MAG: glutamine--fructose-6-phosphate aminotransferase, partial [Acidobacteria bacterium]|nr:glutamine--fructose-6-phosphate aminotransferase [Acidobacteriota bacterium]